MRIKRKVSCLNHSSLSVNIPASVGRELNIKKGDIVEIDCCNGVMTLEKPKFNPEV